MCKGALFFNSNTQKLFDLYGLFLFDLFLEAMAEILTKKSFLFGRFEDTKMFFQNELTFNNLDSIKLFQGCNNNFFNNFHEFFKQSQSIFFVYLFS